MRSRLRRCTIHNLAAVEEQLRPALYRMFVEIGRNRSTIPRSGDVSQLDTIPPQDSIRESRDDSLWLRLVHRSRTRFKGLHRLCAEGLRSPIDRDLLREHGDVSLNGARLSRRSFDTETMLMMALMSA